MYLVVCVVSPANVCDVSFGVVLCESGLCTSCQYTIRPEPRLRKFYYVTKGRIMASAEREPIWGSGGCAPSGVQGQSPWSGGLAL
jgi:hypothetical protein